MRKLRNKPRKQESVSALVPKIRQKFIKRTLPALLGAVCLVVQPLVIVSQAPVSSPIPEIRIDEADLIHFGDLIDVDFEGTTEYDWRGSLKQDGNLDGLDHFSSIAALCRSEVDVATDITSVYSKILREPKVSVRIIDRSSRAVAHLDGAVKTPMRFRFQRPARLGELIVAAGGFTDDAGGEIVIFRPDNLNCSQEKSASGNGLRLINISVSELLSGKESANPVVLSGDLISVQKAAPIYVVGAVNNPRPIYARSGISVSRAISTAGGLAKGAASQKVTIFRREGANTTILQVDLEKIKKGEINDLELKGFDIIEVASRGRVQRKHPPSIAAGSSGDRNRQELPLKVIE